MRRLIAAMLLISCRGQMVTGVDPRVLLVPQQYKTVQEAIDAAWKRGLSGRSPKDSVTIRLDNGHYVGNIAIYPRMRVAIVTDKARVAIEGDSTGGNTITVLEQAKLRLENLLVANHQPPGPRQATILADSYSSVILRKTVVTTKSVGLKALYRNVLDVEATEFIGTGAVGIKIHDMARGGRIWESSFINLDVGIDDSCSPIKPKLGKNRDENSNSFRNVRVARIFGPNNCN